MGDRVRNVQWNSLSNNQRCQQVFRWVKKLEPSATCKAIKKQIEQEFGVFLTEDFMQLAFTKFISSGYLKSQDDLWWTIDKGC